MELLSKINLLEFAHSSARTSVDAKWRRTKTSGRQNGKQPAAHKLQSNSAKVPQDETACWTEQIERARSGCDLSLGEILESVRDYLLLITESRLGSHVRSKFGASDIVQFSMLEIQESIENFRGESETEFKQWVKRIVINNLTDEARRYTHTHSRKVALEVSSDMLDSHTDMSHLETPSWHIRHSEFDQQLAQAVSQLPNRQRYVVEARHRHGFEDADIASQLEISEAGVRKLWSRATEKLRTVLEQPQ